MCQFGMKQVDEVGEGCIKKPIGFMTNSWEIANDQGQRCRGDHRHITLQGSRTKRAQAYPKQLCECMVVGLII